MLTRQLEKIRKIVILTLDKLKGAKIQQHYKDIEFILTANSSKEAINRRDEYLKNILQHAVKNSPFYYNYSKYSSLQDFPVINKVVIRENFEAFHALNYKDAKRFPVVTSGSTGTPFKIFQDQNKKYRNSADALFFGKRAGFELGQRVYYLKVWNKINKKKPFIQWLQNIYPQDVSDLSNKNIDKLIQRLKKDKSSVNFLSYASALDVICQHLDRENAGRISCDVKSILAMSESLTKTTKEKTKKYFGKAAISRYSNVENGIIAQQCETQDEFHINNASYVVEILDMDQDKKVEEGKLGRIVVTDLFNYAMPIIRYDTGDIGSVKENAECGFNTPVFTHIEGRRMDLIFNTSGDIVSSFIITNTMWEFAELRQYQFIQNGPKEYLFKLNIDIEFSREKELISKFKDYLGKDAVINIEYVDEIPLLASGKRKKVMNTWK